MQNSHGRTSRNPLYNSDEDLPCTLYTVPNQLVIPIRRVLFELCTQIRVGATMLAYVDCDTPILCNDTPFGGTMCALLHRVADSYMLTSEQRKKMLTMYLPDIISTGILHGYTARPYAHPKRAVHRAARKADALDQFVTHIKDQCDPSEQGIRMCDSLLVQVVLQSGKRYHLLQEHMHAALQQVQSLLHPRDSNRDNDSVISVVEIPTSLQCMQKLYIDWDKKLSEMLPLLPPGSVMDAQALVHARALALQTPAVFCRVLQHVGVLSPCDSVQVTVVEGSRWKSGMTECKVSFHFVFQILLSRRQLAAVWGLVMQHLQDRSPTVYAHIHGNGDAQPLGDAYECLYGVDIHPIRNKEQGLALPWSSKSLGEVASRMLKSVVVQDGKEQYSVYNDPMIWAAAAGIHMCARVAPYASYIHFNPTKVASALMEASICFPGPKCLKIDAIRTPLPDASCDAKQHTPRGCVSPAVSSSVPEMVAEQGIVDHKHTNVSRTSHTDIHVHVHNAAK